MTDTRTGDTLCDEKNPILLENITFPEPVIFQAIEPKTKGDQDKLGIALTRLAQEDPTFRMRTDEETQQTIIGGMGELHLEIILDRLKREFKVEANVGKPQVAYKEAITKTVEAAGQIRPADRRQGPVRRRLDSSRAAAGRHRLRLRKQSRRRRGAQGIHQAGPGGHPRSGRVRRRWPVTRCSTSRRRSSTVRYHDVDSSEMAFKIAASMAFREANKKAGPILLEPIMKVEVTTPKDYLGAVNGDLNRRRGRSNRKKKRRAVRVVITADVPLSEMFGYATDMRSADARPGDVHDGVLALREGAEVRRRRDRREGSRQETRDRVDQSVYT